MLGCVKLWVNRRTAGSQEAGGRVSGASAELPKLWLAKAIEP